MARPRRPACRLIATRRPRTEARTRRLLARLRRWTILRAACWPSGRHGGALYRRRRLRQHRASSHGNGDRGCAGATGRPRDDEERSSLPRGASGAVFGDLAPELQLGAADIRSLGVTSVDELLAELRRELVLCCGRAAHRCFEGRRLPSFAELRRRPRRSCAPTCMPEAVAVAYGYSGQPEGHERRAATGDSAPDWRDKAAGGATESGAANAPRGRQLSCGISPRCALQRQRAGEPRRPVDRGSAGSCWLRRARHTICSRARCRRAVLDPALSCAVRCAGRNRVACPRAIAVADARRPCRRTRTAPIATDLADRRTPLLRTDMSRLTWSGTAHSRRQTTITLNGSV